MANANPVSGSGVTGRASIPSDASKQGGINETTPLDQRNPRSNAPETAERTLNKDGGHEPCQYPIVMHLDANANRAAQDITLIRVDR
jgi:hypothetical protein